MAEAGISVDQFSVDEFSCSVCLDLLTDPVATSCGHSFCTMCINDCWDQEDQRGVYSCPQCRETFTPRPALRRNTMLAEVVEKLKKTELQAASSALCYSGPGDVTCDFCTGRKLKAIKSCLTCLASFCETHLKPHHEVPGLKKHSLVEACAELEQKICSHHDKEMEIYCRTDQSFICYLCLMEEHKGHDTVTVKTERREKESELKEDQKKSQQRIQEKQKKVQEIKQTVVKIKSRTQAAVEDNERIFTKLISFMKKKRSAVTKLIRDQEKAELKQAEELLQQLEQEITDLKRSVAELEQLSHSHDHIHFLQKWPSLRVASRCENSSDITINQQLSFDHVTESLSHLKEVLEKLCEEELKKIPPQAAAVWMISITEPKSREDFLRYSCQLTLDPNTAHRFLRLSEENKVVTFSNKPQRYPDHPERFDSCMQVLCKERVSGRCYWEVDWSDKGDAGVFISVSYKEISRKGRGDECKFGPNNQSWSLWSSFYSSSFFYHNNIITGLKAPSSSRIGVYVDHGAGILSFYSVSDGMKLLHRVQTTFTQPLYAGFGFGFGFGFEFYPGSTVRFCDAQ